MALRFEIHFEENSNGMYFTGQVVKGRAVIYVNENIPFKGIQLRVRGYAKVRWEESSTGSSSVSDSEIYSDEEKYFDALTNCMDTKGHEQTLNPGVYTYTFECVLPSECPSSFEGSFGRIRYSTKITVIRPLAFNKSYSMGFSVLKMFDLNQFPELRIPAKMEEFKHFCCGPCKSSPLVLSLEIQRTSFVPGEFIQFNAKLVNTSSTKVENVSIALNLIALYSVRTRVRTKTERIAVAEKKFGGFERDSLLEFKENLQVPPTPPTCDGPCRIIKITYEVAVTARVKGAHLNPVVAIPVIVGNIPYVEKSSSQTEDIEYPPPSYEEATFVANIQASNSSRTQNVQNQINVAAWKFTPKYTFYSEPICNKNSFEESKG